MSRRLLIVDDHPGFRRTAARSLGAAGWEVVGEAADGEGALREAERCAPDLVLLDVGLPDISGIEVARRLHDRDPDLAVVVTSTHDRADYGELAARSGARGFVSKLDLDGKTLEALLESRA
ncbi:MAG TPA: response regulator transcription factor [Solirubrobacterales bacterium]|nr:response regulator transcription factor [Solirubrobacterales bacterium]